MQEFKIAAGFGTQFPNPEYEDRKNRSIPKGAAFGRFEGLDYIVRSYDADIYDDESGRITDARVAILLWIPAWKRWCPGRLSAYTGIFYPFKRAQVYGIKPWVLEHGAALARMICREIWARKLSDKQIATVQHEYRDMRETFGTASGVKGRYDQFSPLALAREGIV